MKCGRTACSNEATSGPHVHSGVRYCAECQGLINRVNEQVLVPDEGQEGDATIRQLEPGGFWKGLRRWQAGEYKS